MVISPKFSFKLSVQMVTKEAVRAALDMDAETNTRSRPYGEG